ncbi:MAG TPA: antibiotic biosynthesis monooxygenase [Kofleriaceae bacterium]|nr:antibiotic biosynthesis monooxygenase [Kofleriaceae bacterium]
MLNKSFVVRIVARPGQEEQVARFLAGALPLAEAETTTPVWFALRASPSVFYIVDAFADDADRQRHLDGPIAAALKQHAPELLAERPEILPVDVLAAKVAA